MTFVIVLLYSKVCLAVIWHWKRCTVVSYFLNDIERFLCLVFIAIVEKKAFSNIDKKWQTDQMI